MVISRGHSGLQKDVLKLFRDLLRVARSRDARLVSIVSKEFRERAFQLNKNEFERIEHSIRYGYKKERLMKMPGFSAAQTIESSNRN